MSNSYEKEVEFSKEHLTATLEALFVTILWSSSWVIIKIGLQQIPPLLFSGLRYSVASVVLLGYVFSHKRFRKQITARKRRWWGVIALYGIIFVTLTQGAQFVALSLLPAITVSFMLNLTPLIVLVAGILFLKEIPSRKQVIFFVVGLVGVLFYFYPLNFPVTQIIGLLVAIAGVLSNAGSSLLGRKINKKSPIDPVVITSISMGIGSIALLGSGLFLEGMVPLSPSSIIYVLWLAIVNTAIAFTLWNRAMRVLRAVDVSLINSTMLPQIVILSILFLGEIPGLFDWVGLAMLALSVVLIQLTQAKRKGIPEN